MRKRLLFASPVSLWAVPRKRRSWHAQYLFSMRRSPFGTWRSLSSCAPGSSAVLARLYVFMIFIVSVFSFFSQLSETYRTIFPTKQRLRCERKSVITLKCPCFPLQALFLQFCLFCLPHTPIIESVKFGHLFRFRYVWLLSHSDQACTSSFPLFIGASMHWISFFTSPDSIFLCYQTQSCRMFAPCW